MPRPPADALRAALFEPEGVLFDLRAARALALREGLAGQGVRADALDPAALARAAALPAGEGVRAAARAAAAAGDAAARACDEVALDLAAHQAERAFADHLARAPLTVADGAREAVAALGARLRLGVVTRLPRAAVERLLDAAGLAPAFAVVVAADDRAPAAPRPGAPGARYAAALARLAPRVPGLVPAQAVAVVDADAAAADARAAGLRTALVCADAAGADVAGRDVAGADSVCDGASDARHTGPGAAPGTPAPRGADVRLVTLRGLTAAALACALDLAPTPCTRPRP